MSGARFAHLWTTRTQGDWVNGQSDQSRRHPSLFLTAHSEASSRDGRVASLACR